MYRRPKFLDALLEIRREMSRDADNDVGAYVEMVLAGRHDSANGAGTESARPHGIEQPAESVEPVLEGSSQAIR